MKRHVGDFVRVSRSRLNTRGQRVIPGFGGSGMEVGARHDGLCDPLSIDIVGA